MFSNNISGRSEIIRVFSFTKRSTDLLKFMLCSSVKILNSNDLKGIIVPRDIEL